MKTYWPPLSVLASYSVIFYLRHLYLLQNGSSIIIYRPLGYQEWGVSSKPFTPIVNNLVGLFTPLKTHFILSLFLFDVMTHPASFFSKLTPFRVISQLMIFVVAGVLPAGGIMISYIFLNPSWVKHIKMVISLAAAYGVLLFLLFHTFVELQHQ